MGSRFALFSALMIVAACGDPEEQDVAWVAEIENQPSALLSVWGSSATDVWAVGGDPRTGTGPLVLHYDGTGWTTLDTGVRNVDLWWVHGFANGPVFMSGSNGTILRYQNGTFETMTTPGTAIVFGMWGAAPDDVWAVGGNFAGGGFAWRFDGTAWTAYPDVPADIVSMGTLWKVNGRSASDLWISGTDGATLHWTGSAFERMDVGVEAPLLSIAGNSKLFVTAGGSFDGVLYENTGSGWTSAIPSGGPRLVGAALSADDAYVVGETGTVLRRTDSGWKSETPRATTENLHAVWIDPTGGVWAVGGQYETPPMKDGVLIHKGEPLEGTSP